MLAGVIFDVSTKTSSLCSVLVTSTRSCFLLCLSIVLPLTFDAVIVGLGGGCSSIVLDTTLALAIDDSCAVETGVGVRLVILVFL
jgi:hypothetical protein